MMSEDRATYLESGTGIAPADRERLDLVREVLARTETWSEPPPHVAENVLAGIAAGSRPARAAGSSAWHWAVGAVATAAAVVALVVGLAGNRPPSLSIDMEGTDLAVGAAGEAVMRSQDAGWWIRLDVSGLPAAESGHYYEGWLWSDEGDGVSVGTFHLRGGEGPITLWSGVDPSAYPSLWVTLEEEDGDPTASRSVMMRGRIPVDG